LVEGAVGISEVAADGDDVWWAESRPQEGGRVAVMRWRDGETDEVTPPDANVRTLVHEYGGAAWWVHERTLFHVDFGDQRLRRLDADGTEMLLTSEPPAARSLRYADGCVTSDGWAICVRERHDADGVTNEIVSVATDGSGEVRELWSGSDFVSSPRISGDETLLAFVSWDDPEMPWTRTRLHVHALVDGRDGGERLRLGGDRAFCEPGWDGDRLLVVVDDAEWWNLHEVDLGTGELRPVVSGPFEIATPPWVFGMQRWAAADGRLVAVAGMPTGDELIVDGRTTTTVDSTIGSLSAAGPGLVAVGAGYDHDAEVIRLSVGVGAVGREVVRPARPLPFDRGYLVDPEWISFPSGPDGAATAHGLFYAPASPAHEGPAAERPPLLVLAHGGPTAQARRQLQTAILYWTSRGIAVVDVDYRGSTGYGRTYRRALDGKWGIADVEDCVAAASYLARRGDVDGDRLMIRGGSAGGFTVLSALAFHDVFAAGASRYGVADLEALATDTHKFEARYLDSLVGPYPETKAVYEARSPINHVDRLRAPMIVLQGDEDAIVPPNQSEMIVDALKANGVEVEYLLFEGEQHGFRKADNIVAALEAELRFFGRILGFEPVA
jgi:dipeptidyl aminopeptidase/acylaminoacyl peptidase